MIILMRPKAESESPEVQAVVTAIQKYPGVKTQIQRMQGLTRPVLEIHVFGPTAQIDQQAVESFPGVESVIRVSERYRSIGRHGGKMDGIGFEYNGVQFSQETFHIFAGLCAVDSPKNTESMFKALREHNLVTTRAGAYKPRTSPYDFQGHGKECLPYVFELAGKYGIKVIAMEITHEDHIQEISQALQSSGNATGVMLQIGTRNAQNFELLKSVGQQQEMPVLFKRGMGITLDESLNACEYIAAQGNKKIVFGLRGVKSNLGDPHRNLVDFAHVPTIKRLTRLSVCVDPSHSVGKRLVTPDGLADVFQIAAQGVIAGANMILVDFHPKPEEALCDGPQALLIEELPYFVEDMQAVRKTYLERCERAKKYQKQN